jgi:hypothetical protein
MLALSITFVSPVGALTALAGVVALAVLVAGEQRLRRICAVVGLRPPSPEATLPVAVAVTLLVILVSLAAAQPVLARQETTRARLDAEAYFVFDISRSMAARTGLHGRSRLQRARRVAKRIRAGIPDVPAGVVSLSDRLLPHLFASPSVNAFNSTVDRGIGVDRPTARLPWGDHLGTMLGTVGDLGSSAYFSRDARRRIAVVLTDGETLSENLESLPSRLDQGHVRVFFVQIWGGDERVYLPGGLVNPNYLPDPTARQTLGLIASTVQSRVFLEGQAGEATKAVRAALGTGPKGTRGRDLQSLALAPFVLALAFVPLGFILYRRNLPAPSAS